MSIFKLKKHNNSFSKYHTVDGKKVYYDGIYSNINILNALEQGTYNREFQNIVSLEEQIDTPISVNNKIWDEFSDKELSEINERLRKIKEEMLKKGIDLSDKTLVLAYLYQVFQQEIKYYDIVSRTKFPISDEIYLFHKNDNLYAALIRGYASSKGICEMLKLASNYFDIACDVVETKMPYSHFLNKVYLENGKVSYVSLTDEIGLIDGYYTFERVSSNTVKQRLKMIKRKEPRSKKKITYFFFLSDSKSLKDAHKNIKGLEKSIGMSNKEKRCLFTKINNKSIKEKLENKKKKSSIISLIVILNLFLQGIKSIIKLPKIKGEHSKKTKIIKVEIKKKDKEKRKLNIPSTLKKKITLKIAEYNNRKRERNRIKQERNKVKEEIKLSKRNKSLEQRQLRLTMKEKRQQEKRLRRRKEFFNIKKMSIALLLLIPTKVLHATKIVNVKIKTVINNIVEKRKIIRRITIDSIHNKNKKEVTTKLEHKDHLVIEKSTADKKNEKPLLKQIVGEVDIENLKVESKKQKKDSKPQIRLTEKSINIIKQKISLIRDTFTKIKKDREERLFEQSIENIALETSYGTTSKRLLKKR